MPHAATASTQYRAWRPAPGEVPTTEAGSEWNVTDASP